MLLRPCGKGFRRCTTSIFVCLASIFVLYTRHLCPYEKSFCPELTNGARRKEVYLSAHSPAIHRQGWRLPPHHPACPQKQSSCLSIPQKGCKQRTSKLPEGRRSREGGYVHTAEPCHVLLEKAGKETAPKIPGRGQAEGCRQTADKMTAYKDKTAHK